MLTSADMDAASPLAVILIGQPTLKRMMKLGVLAALDQRVAVRYTLGGMTAAETASYISHHLKLAGRGDTLLSDDAIALIHQTSRGYPRIVNNLAVHALLAAFADGKAIVDESSTRTAIAELSPTPMTPSSSRSTAANNYITGWLTSSVPARSVGGGKERSRLHTCR